MITASRRGDLATDWSGESVAVGVALGLAALLVVTVFVNGSFSGTTRENA
jgi:hypothetical protein